MGASPARRRRFHRESTSFQAPMPEAAHRSARLVETLTTRIRFVAEGQSPLARARSSSCRRSGVEMQDVDAKRPATIANGRRLTMDEDREFHTVHLPHLINYVVPVVQLKNGTVEVGSGVLVGAVGKHFIATAKH